MNEKTNHKSQILIRKYISSAHINLRKLNRKILILKIIHIIKKLTEKVRREEVSKRGEKNEEEIGGDFFYFFFLSVI